MADDDGKDGGPALVSDMAVLLMEDVVSKLHLLDYEESFCRSKDIQPFTRVYFALPAHNAALQSHHYFALISHLMSLCKRNYIVDKFEDPSSAVNRLVLEVRALGIEIDFPPLKLRAGWGEHCVKMLNYLCDKALEARGFRFAAPVYGDDASGADEVGEEMPAEEDDASPAHGKDDGIEDEVVGVKGGDSDDEDVGRGKGKRSEGKEDDLEASTVGIMESNVDPAAWRTELERVSNRLKMPVLGGTGTVGSKEWRSHLAQTRTAEDVISGVLPSTKSSLERVAGEMADLLEAVASREKLINTSFKHLSAEYTGAHDRLAEMTAAHSTATQRVAKLTNDLATIGEALEEAKATMEEKGSSMTDTSPLIKLKAALAALRVEMKQMDLHLGVVGHAVMQSRIHHKVAGVSRGTGAAARDGGGDDFDVDDEDA